MPQTHQERVRTVLAGERPDRPVLDLGGLDVQRLLLFGTPNEVRAHVRRYFEALGAERYIMAPANSIQPGTPPENIVAAYQTVRELQIVERSLRHVCGVSYTRDVSATGVRGADGQRTSSRNATVSPSFRFSAFRTLALMGTR